MIVADNRWVGLHGIGRYASEVLSRLNVPWVPIAPGGRPSSPYDFATKSPSAPGATSHLVYSPGYNGFLRGVPQVLTLHDLIHLRSPQARRYRPYYELVLKPLIRRNRVVVTVSETSRHELLEWLGRAAADVDVVNAGNGASLRFTRAGAAHVAERPYFLYVGNLKQHKNVDTVLRAMRSHVGHDLYLVVNDTDRAMALASAHNVEAQVRTFPDIDDAELASLYRGAVATLQPSLMEGFGLPALESQLCGTRVVYSAQCASVGEICGDRGLAVNEAKDPDAWAEAIAIALAMGDRIDPGALAERYSWDATARTVSEVLRNRADAIG